MTRLINLLSAVFFAVGISLAVSWPAFGAVCTQITDAQGNVVPNMFSIAEALESGNVESVQCTIPVANAPASHLAYDLLESSTSVSDYIDITEASSTILPGLVVLGSDDDPTGLNRRSFATGIAEVASGSEDGATITFTSASGLSTSLVVRSDVIPEPSSLMLFGSAMLLLFLFRTKRLQGER